MKTKYGLRPVIRIKEFLEQRHLTQKELAEQMGETPQQVNKWVMGVEPCLNALGRMAITFGVSLGELVWHKGDDADFGVDSVVYIRGQIVDTITNKQELLYILKQYYRWTDEECAGIKIIDYKPEKSEIVLGCNSDNAQEFIAWAKKDRDDMFRL